MSQFDLFFLIVISSGLLMGITINTFMAAVISTQCARSRRLPKSSDLLLLGVALTNIPLQSCCSASFLIRFLWEEVYNRDSVWKSFFMLFPFLVSSNFWINTWLCVFYCIRIVNFSHVLFTRLKLRISAMVPWLLLGSVLASLVINLPGIWYMRKTHTEYSTTTNTTIEGTFRENSLWNRIVMSTTICVVPLIVIVIASVLILTSLYRHTQQMRQNMSGFTGAPSLEAHVNAAKTTLSLLVLYIVFDVALITVLIGDGGDVMSYKLYVSGFGCNPYPFINSLILILGNPKLKTAALKTFCIDQHRGLGLQR
ncbi:taste receptor type 2 member 40-like [Lissotriton helveticus]